MQQAYHRRLRLSLAASVLASVAGTAWAQPANETCETATPITGSGAFAFDNTLATTQAVTNLCAGSQRAGADVFYRWTATQTGLATIDTCTTPATFDTTLELWGSCTTFERGCADNEGGACGTGSVLRINAVAGQEYVIRVAGKNAANPARGTGTLTITQGLSFAVGDRCDNPRVLTGPGPFAFDTRTATNDSFAPCNNTNLVRDLWFSWTSPFTGIASIGNCGPVSDTRGRIAVLSGSCESLTSIICAGGGCPSSFGARVLVNAVQGETYLIHFANNTFSAPGTGTLRVEQLLPSANDLCANATEVSESEFSFGPTIADSVEIALETGCLFNDPTADIWYKYTPSASGRVIFTTCTDNNPSDARNNISLYSACDSPFALLACDSETCGLQAILPYSVTEGEPIWVRVSNTRGGSGTLRIFAPDVPANDDCGSAESFDPFDDGSTNEVSFDLNGATTSPEPLCAFGVNDVWYTFVAPISGSLEFSSCGSNESESTGIDDTTVSIHTACGTAALACNDTFCRQYGRVVAEVVEGETYLVRVAAKGVNPVGAGLLRSRYVTAPSNDSCLNAAPATSGINIAVLDGATTDDERCGGVADVWFTYSTDVRRAVSVTDCGLSNGLSLTFSVLDSCGGTPLLCAVPSGTLSFSDCPTLGDFGDYKAFIAEPDVTYLIRVASELGDQGDSSGAQFLLTEAECDGFVQLAGIAESEACGSDANGGCNSDPDVFEEANLGEIRTGTITWDGNTRDLDWYRYVVAADTLVRVEADAEFAIVATAALPPCLGQVNDFARTLLSCGSIEKELTLFEGENWIVVTHQAVANGVALPVTSCGEEDRYWLRVSVVCDSIDFNGDALFPDDSDLIDFLSVLAGGACSTGACNDIDFNNDGLFPDDTDLIAFLRVLAGGEC
jgi:hypothetical protein